MTAHRRGQIAVILRETCKCDNRVRQILQSSSISRPDGTADCARLSRPTDHVRFGCDCASLPMQSLQICSEDEETLAIWERLVLRVMTGGSRIFAGRVSET
jgi:hypothetical protein